MSAGGKLSRNNVERNPRVQTTFGKTLYTSTALNLPWDQNLNAGWTIDETIGRGGDQDRTGTRS